MYRCNSKTIFSFMAYRTPKFRRVLHWRIPVYIYLITVIIFSFFIMNSYCHVKKDSLKSNYANLLANTSSSIDLIRIKNERLTSPLLMAFSASESNELMPLKARLNDIINNNIISGKIKIASVYLKKLDDMRSIALNASEVYDPGSMMKIPVMIACLKESMNDPSFINSKLIFTGHNTSLPVEEGSKPVLSVGKSYTIRELIEFMIIDSDNDAMGLLFYKLGEDKLDKVFNDFRIKIPDRSAPAFNMNPIFFSRFMNILYNATYLDIKNSEWALLTLSKAKYDKGLTRNLPKNVEVAHKYGVDYNATDKMLSESAIIYISNDPYLLVVMTKGKNYKKQSDVISEISDNAFEFLNKQQ